MKRLALSLFLAGSTLMAAGLHNRTSVRGSYLEARTADVFTGACFANSEAGQMGQFAVFGWHIDQGTFDGVSLDGLSVVGVVKADVKEQIRALKKEREAALASRDRAALARVRRKIHKAKGQLRRATV